MENTEVYILTSTERYLLKQTINLERELIRFKEGIIDNFLTNSAGQNIGAKNELDRIQAKLRLIRDLNLELFSTAFVKAIASGKLCSSGSEHYHPKEIVPKDLVFAKRHSFSVQEWQQSSTLQILYPNGR